MIRTLPPRGRSVGAVLLAAVSLFLVLAVPASAAGDISVSASGPVTGREPLVITPAGLATPVALTVELTDSAGAAATWRFAAAAVANGQPLSLDLSAPDSGAPPRNGPARVAVSGPAGAVAEATTTIDRSPPAAPALRTVVRADRVRLTWELVAAPDPVTYKLERIVTGGAWTVVETSAAADGFTDRGLEPGYYRYRLTAGVPSAGGGTNWSTPSATQLRIAPAPAPVQPKPAAQPAAQQPATKPRPKPAPQPRRHERPRSVAATGAVRGPVTDTQARAPQLRTNPAPLIATADEPAVDGAAPPLPPDVAAVATPEVAAPAAAAPAAAAPPRSSPERAPVQPFPVTVAPAGSLAVAAATRTPPDPVTLLTGVVFLLLAAGVVARARRRTGRPVIPAWVGRR